ncbi:MAG: hypothetical protein HUK12_08415 [Muribaculaceae bacterium]|nr:hypothetical protein [Muribaculaceae bacterium]
MHDEFSEKETALKPTQLLRREKTTQKPSAIVAEAVTVEREIHEKEIIII